MLVPRVHNETEDLGSKHTTTWRDARSVGSAQSGKGSLTKNWSRPKSVGVRTVVSVLVSSLQQTQISTTPRPHLANHQSVNGSARSIHALTIICSSGSSSEDPVAEGRSAAMPTVKCLLTTNERQHIAVGK